MALTDSKEFRLSLTQAGANFAALLNPILDRNGDISLGKLSDEEVNFLLDHFLHAVPEEISAYTSILESISVKANTPETVDKFLCTKFHLQITAKADADNHITQTFLATQRTGAISRMIDLGLIYREKVGLRVTYATTPRGKIISQSAGENMKTTTIADHIKPDAFLKQAVQVTTVQGMRTLLSQLPIVDENAYRYDSENPISVGSRENSIGYRWVKTLAIRAESNLPSNQKVPLPSEPLMEWRP